MAALAHAPRRGARFVVKQGDTGMTYLRASLLDLAEAALARTPLATRRAIASACGVSSSTLSRAIRDAHGQGFREWQRRVVLARTEPLLLHSDRPLSLKEVAAALGFTSPSTLARWFKAQTGQTPSACRAQHDVVRRRLDDRAPGSSGTPLAGGRHRAHARRAAHPAPRTR